METGFIMLLVGLVAGILVGYLINKRSNKTQGVIYAYCGERDRDPSLLLEYSVPIEDITLRKRVLFDVVVVKQNSQK